MSTREAYKPKGMLGNLKLSLVLLTMDLPHANLVLRAEHIRGHTFWFHGLCFSSMFHLVDITNTMIQ
jgi:hypothetical protein